MPRKKASKKKMTVQKGSKHVLPPPSPVGTRSKSAKSDLATSEELRESGIPLVVSPPAPGPSAAVDVDQHHPAPDIVQDLEDRWDARFARMETAIRSGLTHSSLSSGSTVEPVSVTTPAPTAIAAPAASPAPAPSATIPVKGKSSKSSRSSKKKSKHRSPSPVSSSSDESSDSESSSSSDGESERENDSPSTKKRSKKKGKYDSSKYLPEGKKMDSFEHMMLANLKMALKLLRKERNIKGLLQHLILVAEKAETGTFANDPSCKYDEAVRLNANERGLRSFGNIDPATIFKFLTYDGTLAAERARKSVESTKRQGRGRSSVMYSCYAYNNASEGCKGNCGYRHICSSCGAQGHIFADCTLRRPSAGRGKHR